MKKNVFTKLIVDEDKATVFIKNVVSDCKTTANKLFIPNTNPCLSLLTHFANSELYHKIKRH